jgi:hypothetical protein
MVFALDQGDQIVGAEMSLLLEQAEGDRDLEWPRWRP